MGERRIALKIGSADKLLESLEVGRRMNGNGGVMLARRRHLWRLFCLLLSVLASATMSHAQALAMTNISDVVYRADGTPASGVLLISWPAFSTSDGKPSPIRHETIFDSSQRTRTRAGVNDGIDCQPRHCRRRKVQGRPGEGDRRNCGVFERLDLGQGKPALGVLENIRKTRRRNEKASFGSPFDGDQRRLHSQIIWAGSQRGNG